MRFSPMKLCCFILPAFMLQCGPFPDLRALAAGDLEPPVLLKAESAAPRSATLHFSEPVKPIDGTMVLKPTIQPSEVLCTGDAVVLEFADALTPGAPYYIEVTVADGTGNRTRLITRFFGFNPRVPRVIINEFITQGSGSHPDVVELFVLEDGNTAGLCVMEGTKEIWSDRCILPAAEVTAGDFILVHFKPDGVAAEIDETVDRTASGGKDASSAAWDYWVSDGSGLSGNNGVITVYDKPGGVLLDAVLYSNRTSSSDTNYRGFGSKKVMLQADEIAAEGGWVTEGEEIAPEDGVNPDDSTSTRSICRSSSASDTNSNADWHIVPTRGSTFGEPNSDEVFVPAD